jgi:hypothetical protein
MAWAVVRVAEAAEAVDADGGNAEEASEMPRMDGTGPHGQGPGTGRGLGPCGTSGANTPQAASGQSGSWLGRILLGAIGALLSGYGSGQGGGRGAGGGRGQGRGRRRTP